MTSLNKAPRTWSQLKNIVEYTRKFIYSLNNNVPSNINFREYINPETGLTECRVYFLAGNEKKEITIKYVTIEEGNTEIKRLVGNTIFEANYLQGPNDKKLTKEEQLLRERKRCSFSGITQYSWNNCERFLFTERSELFYFDDKIPSQKNEQPVEVNTFAKGAIDVKICPFNSNLISYIVEDNIWVQDLVTKKEIRLTNTSDTMKSGVPSYAVQEEFNRYSGYWWYPNKQVNADNSITYRLVYEETDESIVEMTYITPACNDDAGFDEYRYPRAGTPNSKVYLKMVEFTVPIDQEVIKIKEKRMYKDFYELFDWFEYLTRADFTSDGKNFWVQIYDRLQGRTADLLVPLDYFIDEKTETEMKIYCLTEYSSDTWTNAHNSMCFLNESPDYLTFISASDETGYLHLYYYNILLSAENFYELSNGVVKAKELQKRQITFGDWCCDADEAISVDQKNHLVYFHAYTNPVECQFYVVDYTNPNKFKQLTMSGFTHHVTMNQQNSLFVSTCSNLKTPSQAYMYEIKNQDQGVENIIVNQLANIAGREDMESNPIELNYFKYSMNSLFDLNLDQNFLNSQEGTQTSLVENFFRAPKIFDFVTPDGVKLYGMVYMPFNYRPGELYPTLMFVYAGPRAQLVTNAYKINKLSRLHVLSLLNYCVVVIDSRGSDNRGLAFESYLKHRMGTVEINDQVMGLEAASNMFNCIDMKRVAIFGWSYGGYMALMGLAQRPDIFKVAISGAPVTTWNLYDTAYTERYMGLPQVNKDAYKNGSVINLAKNFPDEENRLLIIHGLIDENVHFAHTRQFIDAMIKEGKPYKLQIYPNERHGIRSPDSSIHCDLNFYSFLENYL